MRVFLARDADGTLKCFWNERPTRHSILGRWFCKPMCKREFFVIPDGEQTAEMQVVQWESEPMEMRLIVTNRKILWR